MVIQCTAHDSRIKEIYFQVDNIVTIFNHVEYGTTIVCVNSILYFVKETVEEVIELIRNS